jgi:hypothetical protein
VIYCGAGRKQDRAGNDRDVSRPELDPQRRLHADRGLVETDDARKILPHWRIVHSARTSCPCCVGTKLSKIGEDITETLDVAATNGL